MESIKEKLIKKISEFDDLDFLSEIYKWLEDESSKEFFLTTDEQKKAIKTAQDSIKKGHGIPSKLADKEIDQWLNDEK